MDTAMAKTKPNNADIKDMSFERALKELETIVNRLERGDVELEEVDRDLRARRGSEGALRPALETSGGQGREAHLRGRREPEGHRAPRPARLSLGVSSHGAARPIRALKARGLWRLAGAHRSHADTRADLAVVWQGTGHRVPFGTTSNASSD